MRGEVPRRACHAVCLGLGSNLGDRAASLRSALVALGSVVRVTRVSAVYDTAPQLVEEQPRFLNLACCGTTALGPSALLAAAQRIETSLGRRPGMRYGPRVIDIDLLLYDQVILRSPRLTLPHPRLGERAFALLPLAEIAPDLAHPALGARIGDLAARAPEGDVRVVGPLSSADG